MYRPGGGSVQGPAAWRLSAPAPANPAKPLTDARAKHSPGELAGWGGHLNLAKAVPVVVCRFYEGANVLLLRGDYGLAGYDRPLDVAVQLDDTRLVLTGELGVGRVVLGVAGVWRVGLAFFIDLIFGSRKIHPRALPRCVPLTRPPTPLALNSTEPPKPKPPPKSIPLSLPAYGDGFTLDDIEAAVAKPELVGYDPEAVALAAVLERTTDAAKLRERYKEVKSALPRWKELYLPVLKDGRLTDVSEDEPGFLYEITCTKKPITCQVVGCGKWGVWVTSTRAVSVCQVRSRGER